MKNNETRMKKKKYSDFSGEDNIWGYVFILAAVVVFSLFILYPIFNACIISLQKYNPIQSKWVGFDNYKNLIKDKLFFKSIKNTVIYTIFTVPVNIAISFILSILILPFSKRMQTFFKAIYYLPAVASGVSLSVVWLWIYSSLPSGLLNQLIGILGLPGQNWLGQSKTAMFALILMAWLSSHGTNLIIYIAALLAIPNDYFEAAEIDGATFYQKIFKIVLPMVKPTTLFLFVTGVIKSFQVFMNAYMMTGGGPDNNTTMVGLLIFNNAFKYSEFGKASAQALVLAAVIAIISLLQFKFFGNEVEY
jgi:multiple sugar transport system permease protein